MSECPYIHNSWRGLMYAKKNRYGAVCEEWKDFRTFYNDVRPSYKKGLVLRRPDVTKVFSKDNFIWATTAEAGNIVSGRTHYIEYNGESLSIKDWADKLGVSANAIRLRYYNHKDNFTVEEILFGRKKKRNAKLVKDAEKSTIRSKASKMISSYKHKDYENGTEKCDIDIDWMIENILTKPCVYCGDTHRVGCDRIDNAKGHTKDNVVPCCIECNTARNNYFSYEEMMRLGKTIAEIKASRKNK